MSPEDRVRAFGTEALIDEFENNFLEDFQQEFELVEIDDELSLLSWDLILKTTPSGDDELSIAESLKDLKTIANGRQLFAGFDVGRRKDVSDLSVFCLEGGRLIERYHLKMKRTPFDEQEAELDALLSLGNVMSLHIDETGLGMQLAENLVKRWGSRVTPVYFTNRMKEQLGSNLRMIMEQSKVLFKADIDGNFQMHSIKKTISAAGNTILKVEDESEDSETDHHADRFWSRALALFGYTDVRALGVPRVGWI